VIPEKYGARLARIAGADFVAGRRRKWCRAIAVIESNGASR
jgi:hypothetical protein